MRVKATLVLHVWYDDVTDTHEPAERLDSVVDHAIRNGLLTGEGDMVVDTWRADTAMQVINE